MVTTCDWLSLWHWPLPTVCPKLALDNQQPSRLTCTACFFHVVVKSTNLQGQLPQVRNMLKWWIYKCQWASEHIDWTLSCKGLVARLFASAVLPRVVLKHRIEGRSKFWIVFSASCRKTTWKAAISRNRVLERRRLTASILHSHNKHVEMTDTD